ncbi:MAG: SDR family oxidoreductase [Rhodopirellula sp.]|nr:SDR family oxidoreductase [Rhodopirellula sp.]
MTDCEKVVVITGGSKGIGLGCARAFGRHRWKVMLGARGRDDGHDAAQALTDQGYTAVYVPTDVMLEDEIERLIDAAVYQFGRLDCLVNNAGWHPPDESIDDVSIADFERLLRLNLTSTFIGCKFAVPHLRKTRGTILVMSSATAIVGQRKSASYVAGKAAQIGLVRSLALDLASDGIRVNAVCPGAVRTPLMEQWAATQSDDPQRFLQDACGRIPLGRMGTIDEIGELCAFLASDAAGFITGQAICPDGGATLG